MAIKKYKTFQTGANSQFGGESSGLTSCAYHVFNELCVNTPPIAPAPNQLSKETINLGMLFTSSPPSLKQAASAFTCENEVQRAQHSPSYER